VYGSRRLKTCPFLLYRVVVPMSTAVSAAFYGEWRLDPIAVGSCPSSLARVMDTVYCISIIQQVDFEIVANPEQ
jgi:hypothetical protein